MERACCKRGRGKSCNGRAAEIGAATTKKKAKGAAEVVEERKNEGFLVVEEEETAAELLEELWLRSWIGVDEGMPWATWWLPFWEVEDALYRDVVWDFDIWGLKTAHTNAPSLQPSKRERS